MAIVRDGLLLYLPKTNGVSQVYALAIFIVVYLTPLSSQESLLLAWSSGK